MHNLLVLSALALTLSTGQAAAQSEGGGDPFAFQAEAQATSGRPFVTDVMVDHHPQPTGETAGLSSLAQLEPAPGHETPVQSAASLPPGFSGSVLPAQPRDTNRDWAARR